MSSKFVPLVLTLLCVVLAVLSDQAEAKEAKEKTWGCTTYEGFVTAAATGVAAAKGVAAKVGFTAAGVAKGSLAAWAQGAVSSWHEKQFEGLKHRLTSGRSLKYTPG